MACFTLQRVPAQMASCMASPLQERGGIQAPPVFMAPEPAVFHCVSPRPGAPLSRAAAGGQDRRLGHRCRGLRFQQGRATGQPQRHRLRPCFLQTGGQAPAWSLHSVSGRHLPHTYRLRPGVSCLRASPGMWLYKPRSKLTSPEGQEHHPLILESPSPRRSRITHTPGN